VCPVKIEIPKLLLQLRAEVTAAKEQEGKTVELLAFRMFGWLMRHPKIYAFLGTIGARLGPYLPLRRWTQERDLPRPASKSFRQLWRDRTSK
jgi:L-lactate dehydrogenase complex protein LldF